MMLTGAYEGFIVACHRHRDQAYGNCSGFRWEEEGRKLLVCIWLFCLAKRERDREKREREEREEKYPFLPFYRLVDSTEVCWAMSYSFPLINHIM